MIRSRRRGRDKTMAAVQQDGMALMYAAEEMKRDKEVVMAAVQQRGCVLVYASDEMKRDKEVVMAAVQQGGCALRYASEEMTRDKEVVMAAVQQNGLALAMAAEEMTRDKEVVMAAARQDWDAIEHAPTELQHELQSDADRFGVSVREFCEASMNPPTVIQIFPRWSGDSDAMQISCVGVDREEVMVFPLLGTKNDPQQLRSALAKSVGVSAAALQIMLPSGSRLRDCGTTSLSDLMAVSV